VLHQQVTKNTCMKLFINLKFSSIKSTCCIKDLHMHMESWKLFTHEMHAWLRQAHLACSGSGFINVFSKNASSFHRHSKTAELFHEKNFPLDDQTRRNKTGLTTGQFAQCQALSKSLMKPLVSPSVSNQISGLIHLVSLQSYI